ncbi:Uncharacterised protein [uncultured archaeon]|nr:Uncharacterised protein [uncultured archaeon]
MIIDDHRIETFVKNQDNENLKIWRYIDFPKFVSLLHERKLFFVQACYLPDKYEGFWSKTNKNLDEYLKELKHYTCISCWQKKEQESALMWEVYPRNDNGIAIQSTFNRLWQSFDTEKRDLYVFKVHYTNDILKDIPKNTFKPFIRKRIYFEDDHEIRIIYQEIDKGIQQGSTIDFVNNGSYIMVDLNKLIENIYISPKAEKWFSNLVQAIVDKYDLDIKVKMSPLRNVPAVFENEETSEGQNIVLDYALYNANSTDPSGNTLETTDSSGKKKITVTWQSPK